MKLEDIKINTLKSNTYKEGYINGSSLYALIFQKLNEQVESLIQNRISHLEEKINEQEKKIREQEESLNNIKSNAHKLSFLRLIMNSNMEKTIDNNTIWINDQGEFKIKVNNEIKKIL